MTILVSSVIDTLLIRICSSAKRWNKGSCYRLTTMLTVRYRITASTSGGPATLALQRSLAEALPVEDRQH